MMCAMFTHEAIFKEASARVIHFPGVSKLAFFQLLYFLYTDKSPLHINEVNCVDLIELANRLCLPRLVSLVEASIIQLFNEALEAGSEISEEALKLLQPCQVSYTVVEKVKKVSSQVNNLSSQVNVQLFLDYDQ